MATVNMSVDPTDVLLVSGVADGSASSAETLYHRCRNRFLIGTSHYGRISADDKGDLLQDSFIILWRRIEARDLFADGGRLYVKGRHGTHEVTDLMAYFMRIVRNKYLETLRVIGRNPDVDITAPRWERLESTPADPSEYDDDDRDIVARCLMMLPRRCQELIDLFYAQGLSLDDIIALRGGRQSYKGLKTAKYKCLKNLRERVADILRQGKE